MAKLKLGAIGDDKPIKLAVELPEAFRVRQSGLSHGGKGDERNNGFHGESVVLGRSRVLAGGTDHGFGSAQAISNVPQGE